MIDDRLVRASGNAAERGATSSSTTPPTMGCKTLLYTHAGVPAYMGMNSAGLCVTWIYIDNGERANGPPTCVLIRGC